MSLPIGAVVRSRLTEQLGEVVRGPRRASRGMLWVHWQGRERPMLAERFWLVYVARRGPVEAVQATLEQLTR